MKISLLKTLKRFTCHPIAELVFAGCLLTCVFAPFNILPLAIPALYLLLRNIYRATFKTAFIRGFIFGFAHFLTSVYWIAIALTSNVGDFLWLIPFALVLIPSTLALCSAAVCAIASLFRYNKIWFCIGFALSWVLVEYCRSYWSLPFPWNLLGHSLAANIYTLAVAPFLGEYMASFFVLVISVVWFTKAWRLCGVVYSCAIAFIIFANFTQEPLELTDMKVRIVQPNIAEHHIGNRAKQAEQFDKLIKLSRTPGWRDARAIIWPESSYPYIFFGTEYEMHILSLLAPPHGYLIMGADRVEERKHLYNSIIAISSNGGIASRYDKQILVPFGEYVPLRKTLWFLDKIAYGIGDFSRGVSYSVPQESDPALKYWPLVCYEVLFELPAEAAHANWLVNVTNDAWFGASSGPYQHLAMSRFKAAESGKALLRAANTGISAMISPYGIVLDSLALNTEGILDVSVPKPSRVERNFHTLIKLKKYYNRLILVSFLLCLCANFIITVGLSPKNDVS